MVRRTNRRRVARGSNTRSTRSRSISRSRTTSRSRVTPRNRPINRRRTAHFKPWSPSEVQNLRRMYRDTPTREVAKKLGRTISSVQGKAGNLGLRKSTSYMKRTRSSWR